MPELHATLSGLKVWSTVWAHLCMEDLRKSCGGQGFLLSSGITELPRAFADPVTVEGEQVILSLQTARFLIKAAAAAREGKKDEEIAGSVLSLLEPPLQQVDLTKAEGRPELLLA